MSSRVEQMMGLITGAGIGNNVVGTDWCVYGGKFPSVPYRAIVVGPGGGKPPNPKWAVDYPSLQVMVRGDANDYLLAMTKIENIRDALLGLPSQTIAGDRWNAVNLVGDIAPLGTDQNNCPMFSVNFALIIEPANTGNRLALPQ